MNEKEAIEWFDEVLAQGKALPRDPENRRIYKIEDVARWANSARNALTSVLPPGHPTLASWDDAFRDTTGEHIYRLGRDETVHTARGVLESACYLLKSGRLSSFVQGIRAETVTDLLDQAECLADQNYLVAATVVAGGALETFLHFTCTKNRLEWQGHGSIEKYKDAMARARKEGTEIISATDEKNVTAWGGMRNDAAHQPTAFNRDQNAVKTYIESIRQFIGRYAG